MHAVLTDGAMPTLFIFRGAPGSGKSTAARNLPVPVPVFEADQWMVDSEGRYSYDPRKIGEAHAYCQAATFAALLSGHSVAVANTFTKIWEIAPYLAVARASGSDLRVYHCTGSYGNIHSVPQETIERMLREYQPTTGEKVLT